MTKTTQTKGLNRWVYLVFGVIALLFAGFIYAWSVISKSIAAYFTDWTTAQLSMTFTLVMAFFCIGGMIAGFTAKKIKAKWYMFFAAILLLAGFLIAGNANTLAAMYLGFGVIGGIGVGFLYNAVLSTMSAWFPDKQGLISGILLMGFGFGSFFIGKVYAMVTPSDGSEQWRTTFFVLAVILCLVVVVCGIFMPGHKPDSSLLAAKKVNLKETAMDIGPTKMLCKPSFWLYYIWAILVSAAGLTLVSQSSGIAAQVGPMLADGTIATVVGLVSIMNGVGRVFFGGIYDKRGYRITMILDMVLFVIAGLLLFFALKSNLFIMIILGFVVGGFAYGGVTPTNSAIISDFFGRTNYSKNFSIINTNLLIASFGSVIAGKLFDNTGSYLSTIIMLIALVIVGFVVFAGLKRPKSKV